MANLVSFGIVVGWVISLGIYSAAIYLISRFVGSSHRRKAITKSDITQTAFRLLKLSALMGLVSALTLLAMYFTSLSGAKVNLWVLAYIPGCIVFSLVATFMPFAFETFGLLATFKHPISGD